MHNPIQKVSLLYYEALASLRSPRNWLPIFVFWVIQAFLLWGLTRMVELSGGGVLAEILNRIFGEEVAEYPRFYLQLPDIQRRLYLLLALFIGVFFQGVALLHLLAHHTGGKLRREHPWRRCLRRWPGLFLINLISLTLFLGPLVATRQWLLPALGEAGPGKAVYLGAYAIGFTAEVFLLYAPFLFVAFSSGWWASLRSSIRFAARQLWTTMILVLVPFFLALPIQGLIGMRRQIVFGFRPELMFHLLLAGSFLTLLVLFMQLSSLVRFYTEERLRRPFEGEWDDKHSGEVEFDEEIA